MYISIHLRYTYIYIYIIQCMRPASDCHMRATINACSCKCLGNCWPIASHLVNAAHVCLTQIAWRAGLRNKRAQYLHLIIPLREWRFRVVKVLALPTNRYSCLLSPVRPTKLLWRFVHVLANKNVMLVFVLPPCH